MADKKLLELYNTLKEKGLSSEKEKRILQEINFPGKHRLYSYPLLGKDYFRIEQLTDLMAKYNRNYKNILNDFSLQGIPPPKISPARNLQTLEDLLEMDKEREKDGFPKKIKLGKIAKPTKGGKVVVVPVTTEDKFIHDDRFGFHGEGQSTGGAGEGEEGDVIGEDRIPGEYGSEDGDEGDEAGQGDGRDHGLESKAYELGKILTEKFELPNLQDKRKKRTIKRYTWELTDKNRGHGQFLDKKATLRKIIETNIELGRIDPDDIDTTNILINPKDMIYRILSREVEYESEAIVFLLRDYSSSMWGAPTEAVVTQHLFLYSWLMYQYERLVKPRFIVHDTMAKELPDFYTYYNISIAGGTDVHTSFKLVNEIVEKENLAKDYNIYVFYGWDGEDWVYDGLAGAKTIPELEKMLTYANRVGITIIDQDFGGGLGYGRGQSEVEWYIRESQLLEKYPKLLKMDVIGIEEVTEKRLIQGIIKLIS